jgi:uncharacterized protein
LHDNSAAQPDEPFKRYAALGQDLVSALAMAMASACGGGPSSCHGGATCVVIAGDRGGGMTSQFESIRGAGTILLTTYKRDGTAVSTPVSVAFDQDRAFFRSYDKAWKTKRLRRTPTVDVAPATFRGKVTGPQLRGTARLLAGDDARTAARALARRHPVLQGALVPVMHRALRYKTLHYELEP